MAFTSSLYALLFFSLPFPPSPLLLFPPTSLSPYLLFSLLPLPSLLSFFYFPLPPSHLISFINSSLRIIKLPCCLFSHFSALPSFFCSFFLLCSVSSFSFPSFVPSSFITPYYDSFVASRRVFPPSYPLLALLRPTFTSFSFLSSPRLLSSVYPSFPSFRPFLSFSRFFCLLSLFSLL